MRYCLMIFFSAIFVFAIDEKQVEQEIANAQSVEALTTRMHVAPVQYRYKYIQAIKEKVALENEERRVRMMEELVGNKETQNSINSRGGRGGGNGGGGSGGGGGGGHGGGGGGSGGGRGGR